MGKLDKAKETLNSLRAYFGVTIVLMITIGGGLASSYRTQQFDIIFWLGFLSEIVLAVFGVLIARKIRDMTNKIEEL